MARFAGKPIHSVSTAEAIRNSKAVIEAALALAPEESVASVQPAAPVSASPPETPAAATSATTSVGGKHLVGITSCPTGIAHTFMAAEALQKAAKALGHTIKVETQGSVGAKNQLTPEEIAAADAVVIAADTKVDTSRFAGKPIYSTSTKQAMHSGKEVSVAALAQPASGAAMSLSESVEHAKAERSRARTGPYKHLMTGVSYMLPVVIAGGLAIALAFAIGGIYAGEQKGTLAAALSLIGGGTAFHLFVTVLGLLPSSIADRPGIAQGLSAVPAQTLGAGFRRNRFRFLAGYLTKFSPTNQIAFHARGLEAGFDSAVSFHDRGRVAHDLRHRPAGAGAQLGHEYLAQRHARRERGLSRPHPWWDDGV